MQVRIRIMQRVHGSAFPEGQVSRQSGHSAPGRLQIEGPAWNLRHGSTTAIDKFQNCIPAAGKVRSGLTGTDTPPQPPTGSPRRSSRFTATPRHQHPRSPRRARPVGAKGLLASPSDVRKDVNRENALAESWPVRRYSGSHSPRETNFAPGTTTTCNHLQHPSDTKLTPDSCV